MDEFERVRCSKRTDFDTDYYFIEFMYQNYPYRIELLSKNGIRLGFDIKHNFERGTYMRCPLCTNIVDCDHFMKNKDEILKKVIQTKKFRLRRLGFPELTGFIEDNVYKYISTTKRHLEMYFEKKYERVLHYEKGLYQYWIHFGFGFPKFYYKKWSEREKTELEFAQGEPFISPEMENAFRDMYEAVLEERELRRYLYGRMTDKMKHILEKA